MGMQLNIKSDEAYRLATRLAELTGESLTTAVTEALREKVATREREQARDEKLRRVLEIAAGLRAELHKAGDGPLTTDWLYDGQTGLPI